MYSCDVCKKAPKSGQWPRKWQWKTEKGFNEHTCYARTIEANERRASDDIERRAANDDYLKSFNPEFAIGDEVYAVNYYISKPTHDVSGRRVRYEEERVYSVRYGRISGYHLTDYADVRRGSVSVYYSVDSFWFLVGDIFKTQSEAQAHCDKLRAGYNEHVDFSRMCR